MADAIDLAEIIAKNGGRAFWEDMGHDGEKLVILLQCGMGKQLTNVLQQATAATPDEVKSGHFQTLHSTDPAVEAEGNFDAEAPTEIQILPKLNDKSAVEQPGLKFSPEQKRQIERAIGLLKGPNALEHPYSKPEDYQLYPCPVAGFASNRSREVS